MSGNTSSFFRWAPRVAGILVSLFLALFALDVFEGRSFFEALPGFVVHLVPSFVVLAVVALSWRFEWIGAVAFVALALAYAVMVRWRLDWVAGISGPLLVVGIMFLVSWRRHAAPQAAR